MRRVLITTLAIAAFAAATPAFADQPPTLHGFCSLANQCFDNGTNTPTNANPPQFGFAVSGGAEKGAVLIDILVPDNVTLPPNYVLSGALLGNSTVTTHLVSNTPWTSNSVKLDSYLGLNASPSNPLGAYLPTTKDWQPTATGFYVFQASIGTVTLPGTGDIGTGTNQDDFLMTLNQKLAFGSYIVAFITQDGGQTYKATANSGAILEMPEPGTWALMLLGFGGIGLALRRRRKPALAQLA